MTNGGGGGIHDARDFCILLYTNLKCKLCTLNILYYYITIHYVFDKIALYGNAKICKVHVYYLVGFHLR